MTEATDGLLSSLWRASWQGALALVLVGFLCRVLARRLTADAHCWLWRLSYVKLLVGLIWSGAILLPMLPPVSSRTPLAGVQAAAPTRMQVGDTAAMVTGNALPITPATDARPRLTWQEGMAAAYLLGVAACLGRLLLAARRARHALRSAVPITSGPEIDYAVGLAQRMGLRRLPSLTRSAAVDGPVFLGGRVLLPADARYSESEMRMILAHELAHARRRDLPWEWLGTLVQVVFFFHPLVVRVRREERLAREAAADALALAATKAAAADYGRMLLSLALGQNQPRPVLLGAVGVIEGRDAPASASARPARHVFPPHWTTTRRRPHVADGVGPRTLAGNTRAYTGFCRSSRSRRARLPHDARRGQTDHGRSRQ